MLQSEALHTVSLIFDVNERTNFNKKYAKSFLMTRRYTKFPM